MHVCVHVSLIVGVSLGIPQPVERGLEIWIRIDKDGPNAYEIQIFPFLIIAEILYKTIIIEHKLLKGNSTFLSSTAL